MKKVLFSALLLSVALTVGAVRAEHKLFPVRQADGSTVMLYKIGDGRLAFYTTPDGKVVVRDGKGRLCYGMLDSRDSLVASTMVVHDVESRTAEEKAYVSDIKLTPGDKALQHLLVPAHQRVAKAADGKRRAKGASTADGLGSYNTRSGGVVPSLGTVKIPVILVNFSNVGFNSKHSATYYEHYFNNAGYNDDDSREVGSVRDYFIAQSFGKFKPRFYVVGKVFLSNPYSYYGSNSNGSGTDSNAHQLFEDAVQAAWDGGADFSQYVVNGVIPNVVIIYAGLGEATGGDENTIWPHEQDLTTGSSLGGLFGGNSGRVYDPNATSLFNRAYYDFGSYFMGNEFYGADNSTSSATAIRPMGIGLFVHEFSHALGLPDFYPTTYSYSGDEPFGYWSVMDGGEYEAGTYAPLGYTAYERSYMGWLRIPAINAADTVTLNRPDTAGYAVLFHPSADNGEYYILENRQPGTWFPASLGSGLMVSHFAYNSSAWTNNTVNNTQSAKRAYMVTADGSKLGSPNTLAGYHNNAQLFGNGVNNYKDAWAIYGGGKTLRPIYKVISHADGTLTFNFRDSTLVMQGVKTNGKVYEKVESVDDIAANDTIIFVNEHDGVALTSLAQGFNFRPANIRVSNGKAYGNEEVAAFRLRYAKNNAKWGFQSAGGYLSASQYGLASSSSAANAMADITITGGDATIHFTGSDSRYLGYSTSDTYFGSWADAVATVQIYKLVTSGASGIRAISANTQTGSDNGVYTISGQYAGSSMQSLPKGVYIRGGKKVVVK